MASSQCIGWFTPARAAGWFGSLLIAIAGCGDGNTVQIEVTDYRPPQVQEDGLTDDKLADKTVPDFDPQLIDRRPLEGWLVNSSAAVVRLDVPLVRPDREPELLTLHPSYAAAIGGGWARRNILPSVNLIDGKAKQFDDGLYAALELVFFEGIEQRLASNVDLVRRLLEGTDSKGPAAPFLAAALELAGTKAEVADAATKRRLLAAFRGDETASKPVGFYTWNDTLKKCFQFMRFLQREFAGDELPIPLAISKALAADNELLDDYRQADAFYARLTNPHLCLSMADLVDHDVSDGRGLDALCREKQVWHRTVALFPPASSRETILFEKLFPRGLPESTNLMKELVRRIRSGEVDLTPKPDSGWYDYQVFALETMLLTDRGPERDKLLLTRPYKRRMLEAFQALLTKRRETHVRDLASAGSTTSTRPSDPAVEPRLRVEPAATYYLRTARAYAFLAGFLQSTLGRERLAEMHGLTAQGARTPDLWTELIGMRDLFYGLYLVSADDIGLKTSFLADESLADSAERDRCYELVLDWLSRAYDDPDLAVDTRVSVPIYIDRPRGATRLWMTLGVRLTRLVADYARPPQIKPASGEGDWKEPKTLGESHYLIAVDEFAEVELPGLRVLNREELRAICDRAKTKEAILRSLEMR